MIYTQFGSPVKIIGIDDDAASELIVTRLSDGKRLFLWYSQLRADNGAPEIDLAITRLKQEQSTKGQP